MLRTYSKGFLKNATIEEWTPWFPQKAQGTDLFGFLLKRYLWLNGFNGDI
jgi:hypothetical protein